MKKIYVEVPKGDTCGSGKNRCLFLIEEDAICAHDMDLGGEDGKELEKAQECLDKEEDWPQKTYLHIPPGQICGFDCEHHILHCHGTALAGHYCSVYLEETPYAENIGRYGSHFRCAKCKADSQGEAQITANIVSQIDLYNTEDGHNKLYYLRLYDDGTIEAEYGKGTGHPQYSVKTSKSFKDGQALYDTIIKQKIKKGYKEDK